MVENIYKKDITLEIRKSNFNGKYQLKHPITGAWSRLVAFTEIKKYCKSKNLDCPNLKDLKFFSDGFEWSYTWFDGYGKEIPVAV